MYTSMTVIALTSLLTLQGGDAPGWQTDYGTAQKQAASMGKPVAVVFGSGKAGYEKIAEGGLNAAARKALADGYVCCYVDVSTKSGQELAASFEITKGVGIVLSDRGGKLMAFHHDGDLSVADVRRCLERFADPSLVVRTTVTNLDERTSSYSPTNLATQGLNGLGSSGLAYPGAYGSSPFGATSGYCPTCSGGSSGGGRRR